MENIPRKVLWHTLGDALGPQPVSSLDPTFHTLPKTKHTCELAAVHQVQAGKFHTLEHLDVAWDNGVDGRRVRRNGESSQESSLGDALGPQPVSNLDPTYHIYPTQDQTHL